MTHIGINVYSTVNVFCHFLFLQAYFPPPWRRPDSCENGPDPTILFYKKGTNIQTREYLWELQDMSYSICTSHFTGWQVYVDCRGIFKEYRVHPLLHRNRNRFFVVPKTISPPSTVDQLFTHSPLCAGMFKQSMGARNRVGIGLSRPAKLHSLAELVPWYRFLGSLKV
jgi:hypothetical protein